MVLSRQPSQMNGSQNVPPSLLQSNSGLLGGDGGPSPSQSGFPSLLSPHPQFNNMDMLGSASPASSYGQSFGNGCPNAVLPGSLGSQRAAMESRAELDPLGSVGNGMKFNTVSSSFMPSSTNRPGTLGVFHGQQFAGSSGDQLMADQSQNLQQLQQQSFQHGQRMMQQLAASQNLHQQQQLKQQIQSIRGGVTGAGPVKLEPNMTSEASQSPQQPPLNAGRNHGPVKLEPQHIQSRSALAPVKLEPNHSEQSLFLQQQQQQFQQRQQQQQQQLLNMSRQPSATAAAQLNLLHQQRLMHLQQQQLMKTMPQQRDQAQQQFLPQNIPLRSTVKAGYETGTCARRLTEYMYRQQNRPEDNNIDFWRKFVAEYFAPNAKKKWCVSMYGSGRQSTGVVSQDVWCCDICNCKPGRGFEATVEVLPRLFKIKYESGTLEELLYVDMPREYQNSSGQIVLDYAKAIQESVFEQLRVVRDGQLRIVFSPDLKICSWGFCARRHEELIPRRLLIPQVSQLGAAAQKYQAATQNASSGLSVPELQNNCNLFLSSARQLAKALEVPLVNDLGYTKRYVRCLQISEVVNCMKDLIDYSRQTGTGPMESLAKYPRRTSASMGVRIQLQQPDEQPQSQSQQQKTLPRPHPQPRSLAYQSSSQDGNSDQSCQVAALQHANCIGNSNNPGNAASTASAGTVASLLHQNSMNSRQQSSLSNSDSPYGGNGNQITSPGSCTTVPPMQANADFQSPANSSSNNPLQHGNGVPAANQTNSSSAPVSMSMHQTHLANEAELNETQSSVQKILREVISGQLHGNGGMTGAVSLSNDVRHANGSLSMTNSPGLSNSNSLLVNGFANNSLMGGGSFSGMVGSLVQPSVTNGIRGAIGNGSMMNGRMAGMTSIMHDQGMTTQQDLSNQLLAGLRAVNGFNNMKYDWKPSP
ncbi:hypothetical protein MLD38_022480 [Melastoma candidum]|uniref:Uncharacterized protein n=1 Tax=Melastoma candidum TaxID=119954 RepID=A0ACB9QSI4_9MYRT|nr:hypothetical protein MLD38_022480 [Melastoma candidum]